MKWFDSLQNSILAATSGHFLKLVSFYYHSFWNQNCPPDSVTLRCQIKHLFICFPYNKKTFQRSCWSHEFVINTLQIYLTNIDKQLNFTKLQECNSRVWFKNKCELVARIFGFWKKLDKLVWALCTFDSKIMQEN